MAISNKLKINANVVIVGVLLLALVSIGLSVYQLQKIFLSENERSRNLLEARRDYIENAAKLLFIEQLDKSIEAAIERMEALAKSPFVQEDGLYWRKNDKQILPLDWNFQQQIPGDNVIALYEQLHSDMVRNDVDVDGGWPENLKLLWQFSRSLFQGDSNLIEQSARGILSYDANHRFASRQELVFRLLFAEQLSSFPQASRSLLSSLIRDDLTDNQGAVLPALQKDLLWRRNDLSREEFEFLVQKIVGLSKMQSIRHDDFLSAANPEGLSDSFSALPEIKQPTLWGTDWYMVSRPPNQYGVKVDVGEIHLKLQEVLKQQQWLTSDDSISMHGNADNYDSTPRLYPIDQITFEWSSNSYRQNLEELQRFYRLKQFILMATVLSLIAASFLVWWLYRRQVRWVGVKSEFVATVAHEMRTPLSSIRLMAERLSATLVGETKAKDYPQRILSDIDTLSFLAENILSFERLQSGQWVTHKSPVSLREVVNELRDELPLFVKIPFVIDGGGNDAHIEADPTLIKLLFLNLAKNSCAYNNNPEAAITIGWEQEVMQLRVDFIDNGIGITKDEWQDSFVPFYRGKDQRHTRGSGLGLALCQKIMALHGGDISIVDSSGRGTHFQLLFSYADRKKSKLQETNG